MFACLASCHTSFVFSFGGGGDRHFGCSPGGLRIPSRAAVAIRGGGGAARLSVDGTTLKLDTVPYMGHQHTRHLHSSVFLIQHLSAMFSTGM